MYDPGIDLVVVAYHSMADLRRFVVSYEVCQPQNLDTELVIVLVEATDGEIATADSWGYPVLIHRENVGFNVACNEAAANRVAGGGHDAIVFLNADTELRPGTLQGCYAHLQQPGVGIVGPRQVNRANQITHAGIAGTHTAPAHRGWKQPDRGQFNDVIDVVTVSGSAYFVRRDVYDLLAGCPIFKASDPNATGAFLTCIHYFGESWISWHAHAHGYLVRYVGDVPPMIHEWHQASPQGGIGEQNWKRDQAQFRAACADHGIACD